MVTRHRAILIAAYKAKAAEALELSRQAHNEGRQTAHSGYLSECLYWRSLADAVAHRTAEIAQEVSRP